MEEVVTAEAAAEKVVFQKVAAEVAAEVVAEVVAEESVQGPGAVVAAEVSALLGANLEAAVADDRFCLLTLEKCHLIIVQVICNLTNVWCF